VINSLNSGSKQVRCVFWTKSFERGIPRSTLCRDSLLGKRERDDRIAPSLLGDLGGAASCNHHELLAAYRVVMTEGASLGTHAKICNVRYWRKADTRRSAGHL